MSPVIWAGFGNLSYLGDSTPELQFYRKYSGSRHGWARFSHKAPSVTVWCAIRELLDPVARIKYNRGLWNPYTRPQHAPKLASNWVVLFFPEQTNLHCIAKSAQIGDFGPRGAPPKKNTVFCARKRFFSNRLQFTKLAAGKKSFFVSEEPASRVLLSNPHAKLILMSSPRQITKKQGRAQKQSGVRVQMGPAYSNQCENTS